MTENHVSTVFTIEKTRGSNIKDRYTIQVQLGVTRLRHRPLAVILSPGLRFTNRAATRSLDPTHRYLLPLFDVHGRSCLWGQNGLFMYCLEAGNYVSVHSVRTKVRVYNLIKMNLCVYIYLKNVYIALGNIQLETSLFVESNAVNC